MRKLLAGAVGSLVLVSGAGFAHHSTVMYNMEKEVTITGTVKEFQYTNPHSWLLVDVKGDNGMVTTWGFEAEGPSTLMRAGIHRSDFKPGPEITIKGHPMKDGRTAATFMTATRLSDHKVFTPRPKS
jgi:hypothetical protein